MRNNLTLLIEDINSRFKEGTNLASLLNETYVPSLFQDKLIARSSLHGRISILFHHFFGKQPVAEKIHAKVLEAFKAFDAENPSFDSISLKLRAELIDFSKASRTKPNFSSTNPLKLTASSIVSAEETDKQMKAKRTALQSHTFISEQPQVSTVITSTIINDWLSPKDRPSQEIKDYIELLYPSTKGQFSSLDAAQKEMDALEKEFIQKNKEVETSDALEHCGEKVFKRIIDLKPGESWLYYGSFGQKMNTALSIAQLAYHIPDYLKVKLSPAAQNIINSLISSSPEKQVEELVARELKNLMLKFPDLKQVLDNPATAILFKNDKQHLPDYILENLPPIYVEAIENLLNKGMLHSLLLFMPESTVKEIVTWISQNPEKLLLEENREKLAGQLETQILERLFPFLKSNLEPLNNTLGTLAQSARQFIRPELMELLGLDEVLSGGNLWIDFSRNDKGNINIKIYGSEQALLYHPVSTNNKLVWPLCFEDMPEIHLTKEFITALLTHALEPLVNPEMASTPREIYNNLFRTIEAVPRTSSNKLTLTTDDFGNNWDFIFNFMIPQENKSKRNYAITKEILLGYLNAKGDLSTLDMAALEELERLALRLKHEAANAGASEDEQTKIKRTLKWIAFEKAVLEKLKPPVADVQKVLPDQLKQSLQKFLDILKITPQKYEECKNYLIAAFGKDIEPLFDLVWTDLQNSRQNLPQFEESKGWLKDTLHLLHSKLIYNAYRLMTGFAEDERSLELPVFSYPRMAHCLLVDFLPSPAKEWYCSAVDYLYKSLRSLAWNFIFSVFTSALDDESLKDLDGFRAEIQNHISNVVAFSNLDFKLGLDKVHSPTSLPWQPETTVFTKVTPTITNSPVTVEAKEAYPFIMMTPIPFPHNSTDPSHLKVYLQNLCEKLRAINAREIVKASVEATPPSSIASGKPQEIEKAPVTATPPSSIATGNVKAKDPKQEGPGKEYAAAFASACVSTWPLPHLEKITIWNTAEDPEGMVESLSEIASFLNKGSANSFKTKLHNNIILSAMDKLVRRVDPHLKGLNVLASSVASLRSDYYIFDVEDILKIRQLIDYFLPEIAFNANKKSLEAQFTHYFSKVLFQHSSDLKELLKKEKHPLLLFQEGIYYQRFINGRTRAEIFPNKKSKLDYEAFLDVNDPVNLIRILERESHILNEKDAIIPRPFALLKRHAIVCAGKSNSMFSSYESPKDEWGSSMRSNLFRSSQHCMHSTEFLPADYNGTTIPKSPGCFTSKSKHTFNQHFQTDSSHIEPLGVVTRNLTNADGIVEDAFLRFLEAYQVHQTNPYLIVNFSRFFEFSYLAEGKYTYDMVSRVIEIISERIDTSTNHLYQWLDLGIKIQNIEPILNFDKPLKFPNYKEIIYKRLDTDNLWDLLVNLFPKDPSRLSMAEKKEGVFAFLMTLGVVKEPTNNFQEKHLLWSEAIKEVLKDSIFANSIAHHILSQRGDPFDPSLKFLFVNSTHFDQTETYFLFSAQYQLNFCSRRLDKFQKDETDNGPEKIVGNESGIWEGVPQQDVKKVHLDDPRKKDHYKKNKEINGKNFTLCVTKSVPREVLSLIGSANTLWVEDTENPVKEVYRDPDCSIFIRQSAGNIVITKIVYKGQSLISIDSKKIQSQLVPILRVCSIDTVQCWADEKTGLLKYIFFDNPQKEISIEQTQEGPKAFLFYNKVKYPLSDKAVPELSTIHSHLKLEITSTDTLVIIPKNQWGTAVMQWGIKDFAPQIANLLREAVSEPLRQFTSFDNHYTYTVEQDDSLDSRDPHALAYLGSLFLVQGNYTLAHKYYEKIIFLSRQKKHSIPLTILQELIPLLVIPSATSEGLDIRRRLLSALGRNDLVKVAKATKDEKINGLLALGFSLVALMDLNNVQNLPKKQRLQDDEEWFLYKFSINTLLSLIKDGELYPLLAPVLSHITPETILNFINLTPELQQRITTLKNKFHVAESTVEMGLNLLGIVRPPQVKLSSKNIPYLSSLNLPTIDLGPNLCWDTLWIKYVSQLCSHVYVRKSLFSIIYKKINPDATEADLSIKGFRKNLTTHFIAYYQLLEQNHLEAPKLIEILKMHRSGWSEESRTLIHILSVVAAHSASCPLTQDLRLIFTQQSRVSIQARVQEFNKVMLSIVRKPYKWLGMKFAGEKLLVPLAKTVLLNTALNPIAALTKLSRAKEGVEFGLKAVAIAKRIHQVHTATQDITPRTKISPTGLNFLDNADKAIEDTLKTIYEMAFVTVQNEDRNEVRFSVFTVKPNNEAEKKKFDIINNSIQAYYKRKGRIPPQNKLRNLESLWHVFTLSKDYVEELNTELKAKKEEILRTLNPAYIPEGPEISFKEWQQSIHDEDTGIVQSKLNLTPEQLNALVLNTTLCLVLQSRINQFNKVLKLLDAAFVAFEKNDGKRFADELQSLGMELQVRRAYNFTSPKVPFRFTYRCLVYECAMERILWKKQIKAYSAQLNVTELHAYTESIPGSGKTEWGLGMQQTLYANGEFVPVTSVPKQHTKTNYRFLAEQADTVYGVKDHTIHIAREQNRTAESYQALRINFMSALENRQGINMAKESSQSLELEFLTKCHDTGAKSGRFTTSKIHEKSLHELQEILFFTKSSCKLLTDEQHHQGKQNRELIHPVGKRLHLEDNLQTMILKTLQAFVDKPEILDAIKKNELYKLDEKYYLETIVPAIAEELSYLSLFQINSEEMRKQFVEYIKDQKSDIPEFIEKHPKWKEISTIRGLLNVVIKKVLPQRINVKFGVVTEAHLSDKLLQKIKNEKLEITKNVCPFEGSNAPMLGFTVQSPYEDFVKTFISYQHNSLDKTQVTSIIKFLYTHAKKEQDNTSKPFNKTIASLYFTKMTEGLTLKENYSSEELDKINTVLKHHPSAIYLYVRYFVADDIYYWERIARSNPTNYVDMHHSSIQKTGTPYNADVYFPGIVPLLANGTTGELLHLISNKCPADGIKVIPNSTGTELLDTIISTYFSPEKNFSLLVDGGSLFNGITNIAVANKLADFCKANNSKIEAIVFFDKDRLVFMNVHTREIRPFSECTLKPWQRITFFDDIHGFGSNVPQWGSAILTYKDQPFYKLLQESLRLREIKNMITLLVEGKIAEFTAEFNKTPIQEIHYVMCEETAETIQPAEGLIPKLKELFSHAISLEANESLPDNYEGYTQHLHNVIRRAIFDKMLAAPNLGTLLEIYLAFEDFLLPPTVVDPIKLFGWMLKEIPTVEAIGLTKAHLLNVVKRKSHWFNGNEVEMLSGKMDKIPVPPMQANVCVLTNGKETETLVNQDLNKELCAEKETSLDTESCQQLEQQQDNARHYIPKVITNFNETKWQMDYDPRSLDWRNAKAQSSIKSKLVHKVSSLIIKKPAKYTNIDLHTFATICERAASDDINNIRNFFDARLWATNNFIPLSSTFSECSPFEYRHCSISEVIVHIETINGKERVVSVGCLSQKEAKRWRTFIQRPATEDAKYKIVLYDVYNRLKVAGDDVDMDALRQDTDFNSLEAQLHFINGFVTFSKVMIKALEEWIKKHDPVLLSLASKQIAKRVVFEQYSGSDLEMLFCKFLHISLEDLL